MASIILLCAGCQTETSSEWPLTLIDPQPGWYDGELHITAGVDWTPSPAVVEALEHGVAVPVRVTTRVSRRHTHFALLDRDRNHRFEVRYLPMVRSYQIIDTRSGEQSTHPRLGMLLDGFRQPRPWSTGLMREELAERNWQVEIRAELDRSRLPSPMRMPVWFDPAWRAVTPWHGWKLDSETPNDD
jgi:hypothetical protein